MDLDFTTQMNLLSLGPTGDRGLSGTREKEELKMAPLFSQSVKNVAEGGNVSHNQLKSSANEIIYPQYGLLSGLLTSFHPTGGDSGHQKQDVIADPRIFLNVNTPWSSFICGSQGSGKSHTLSCMLENCIFPCSTLGKLPKPLAGLVFHYDKFSSYNTGQICEAAYLCSSGIPVTVLVSPSNYWNMKKSYENIPGISSLKRQPVVKPLLLQEKHLNVDRMMRLMAVSESNGPLPLYMETICQILRQMAKEAQGAPGLDYQRFKHNIHTKGLSDKQTDPLRLRLDLLESFMDMEPKTKGVKKSGKDIWKFEAGSLTIVDLSCPFVEDASACVLFDICLALFLEQSGEVGRVVALDEAHKFMTDSAAAKTFTDNLLSVIRLQRHLATRVIISTQEPTISPKLLELSSMTIVHRFTSPQWLATLRSHLAGASSSIEGEAIGKQQQEQEQKQQQDKGRRRDVGSIFETIVNLNVGEALLFSPSAMLSVKNDGEIDKLGMAYLKVRVRKRMTADGGRSILAS